MARLSRGAQAAVFAPLGTLGRTQIVTRRLSDAIALGLLRDGEQLPSEAELAATLGVATVTVREALTALRQDGLVETRRGRGGGSFVTAPEDPHAHVLHSRLREMSLGDLRDLCDHYIAIAGTAALLAADRAGPEELTRIEATVTSLGEATEAGARRRAEGHFHVEVAACSQSARLTRQEIVLQTEVGPLLWAPHLDAATHRRVVAQHHEVARAIAAGDGMSARALTADHVHQALARVSELYLSLYAAPAVAR